MLLLITRDSLLEPSKSTDKENAITLSVTPWISWLIYLRNSLENEKQALVSPHRRRFFGSTHQRA
jgi:hypothetical protein